jgi:hypothetical protein
MNSMREYDYEEIGFFDTLFGLVTQPGETTNILLLQSQPKFIKRLLALVYVTLFGPVIYYIIKYGTDVYNPTSVYGLIVVLSLSIMFFVLFEAILFYLSGIPYSIRQVFALTAYSLTPLIAVFILIYIFNYLSTGSLSFVSLMLNSGSMRFDRFLRIIPYALIIAQINVLVVLTHGIKYLGDMHFSTAFLFSLFSLGPAYISLWIAVKIADIGLPGTKENISEFLSGVAMLASFK